jgi:hypothetical protein
LASFTLNGLGVKPGSLAARQRKRCLWRFSSHAGQSRRQDWRGGSSDVILLDRLFWTYVGAVKRKLFFSLNQFDYRGALLSYLSLPLSKTNIANQYQISTSTPQT